MGNVESQEENAYEEEHRQHLYSHQSHGSLQQYHGEHAVQFQHPFPLHEAAALGAPIPELNRLIVQEGYDVNQMDDQGNTPLHLAAYYGHEQQVLWLLNKGTARFMKDHDGLSPADNARQNGFTELAERIQAASSNSNPVSIRRDRKEGFRAKEEALYQEVDRTKSQVASLKASEKRVRAELEREVAERVKLFRSIINKDTKGEELNVLENAADMRIQVVEYKAQRDALAAEMKLVEEAIADFEFFLDGERAKRSTAKEEGGEQEISPSSRLRACLRRGLEN